MISGDSLYGTANLRKQSQSLYAAADSKKVSEKVGMIEVSINLGYTYV